jgi:hypothetical protein
LLTTTLIRWQPFHGTLLGKLTVLLAPLAGIAVIEALYQTSRKHHGIAFVSVDGYDHYAWVYLPAFVIWLINLSFESVYDLTTIVQPYHMLRRKAATAEDALTYNLQGNILFHNTWLAFAKRRYTVLFASVAVLLGSSLPIAVAGLYTPDETVRLSVIPLQQSTYFNASQGFYQDELPYEGTTLDGDEPPSVKQNGDSMANLVLYNNLSYPRGTYNTFALGEFIIPDSELSNIVKGTYSSVTVQLPAVRGRVNCTSVPQENIYANPVPISSGEISADNPAYIPIQSLTSKGCWNSTGTWAGYTTFEGIANSIEREFIFGRLAGSQVNGGGGDQDTIWPVENKSVTDAGYHGYTAMPAQCPRGMITFGKGLHENKTGIPSDTLTDITVMHCWPYVEQVVLNTTFSVPSMDIISANPLPPDPSLPGGYPFFSEAEILENAGMPVGRGVPQLWANYLSSLETPNDTMAYAFDLFIEAVVWGKGGIPVSELLGPENEDRLIARVDEVYGTIMAQLYNGQGRIPALPDATTLNGTAVNQNQYRVVQSLISTRILEAVLAAMFVCCALAFWELDMKELLPQNPCSIAAAASFVAGSRLVDRSIMPEGSEFLSVKEMMKKGTFDGLKFRMGWWGEGKVKRFGIDVLDSRDAVTEKLVKERTVESDRSTITPPKPPAPSTLETQTPTNRSPARISTNVRPGSPDVSPLEPYT